MNHAQGSEQEDFRLTEQLKWAVRSEAVPPYLEARIRNTIRAGERRASWVRRLAPVAAALLVCLGGVVAYELGHLRLTTSSQESYIASVSNRVATLMRVGLGDHIHCSVFRKFSKNPPRAEELAEKMGQEFRGLIPIIRQHVPEEYRMVIAHQCRYRGRRFVHVSLKSDSRLLSLVIARKNEGESFAVEGMLPSFVPAGIPVYKAGVQRFQIAAFESRDHLVYLVSDLTQQQNINMMVAMAPGVKEFLAEKEL
jgi:hypothetical protein